VPFYAASALAATNVVYGLFAIPESLAPENRRSFDPRRANPIGSLHAMRRFPMVLGLFVVLVFYQMAHDANPSVWTYFTMMKFEWTVGQVGLSLGVFGILNTLVQALLIRRVVPVLGEARTARFGFTMMAVGFMGFAFAPNEVLFLACMVPFALGGLAMPAMRGIMSNAVPIDAQGELQGAMSSVMSLTMIFSPLLMTRLFHAFTSEGAPVFFPGAAHFAAGLLSVGALGMLGAALARVEGAVAGDGTAAP
jgi:DHA1 family tetracycline resistance protein-like MFS transporter